MTSASASSLPHLDPGEASLVNLAIDDPRDTVALSDREARLLHLHNQIQEQELERALLEQGTQLLCARQKNEILKTAN